MSVHAYAWAWQQPCPDSDKLVLLAMCEFADANGLCWPSHATLARMTSRSRATVIRCIERLVANGLVLRAIGKGRSNTYRLALVGAKYPAEMTDQQERQWYANAAIGTEQLSTEGVAPCDTQLSTPVAPCDTLTASKLSHGDTPLQHPLSHVGATGGVASGRDTNSNEPLGIVSRARPFDPRIPERERAVARERLAAIRAAMEGGK